MTGRTVSLLFRFTGFGALGGTLCDRNPGFNCNPQMGIPYLASLVGRNLDINDTVYDMIKRAASGNSMPGVKVLFYPTGKENTYNTTPFAYSTNPGVLARSVAVNLADSTNGIVRATALDTE